MKKNVSMMVASMALLGVGIARATTDIAIDAEYDRSLRMAEDADDLEAQGYSPEQADALAGRVAGRLATADYSEIERRVLAHQGDGAYYWDPKANAPNGPQSSFSIPYDESHALKSLNRQGDLYAQAAAEIMKPGPDEPMPDRFSVNPDSPYYDRRWAKIRIGSAGGCRGILRLRRLDSRPDVHEERQAETRAWQDRLPQASWQSRALSQMIETLVLWTIISFLAGLVLGRYLN